MKLLSTSACPHDCPSTCTLDIEHDSNSIFKINGNKENSYTKGVICAKVSRYRERTHSKKRLLYPYFCTSTCRSHLHSMLDWI